jgi:nucleoredoxin
MGLFKSVEAPTHELIKDSKWSSILGPNLMDKNGKLAQTDDVLKFGKVKRVAIYFSAHWCPPCRRFTPFLASFYEEMQNQVDDDELEV